MCRVLIIARESSRGFIKAFELNLYVVTQRETLGYPGLFRLDETCLDSVVSACATRIHLDVKVDPENMGVPTPSIFFTKSLVVRGIGGARAYRDQRRTQ